MANPSKRPSLFRNSFRTAPVTNSALTGSISGASSRSKRSIRSQLMTSLFLLVLLAVVITSGISGWLAMENGEEQVNERLVAVSALKEARIETWIRDIQNSLQLLVISQSQPDQVKMVEEFMATLPATDADYASIYQTLKNHFLETLRATDNIEEFFLIDKEGIILVSTHDNQEGNNKSNRDYFIEGILSPYISPVYLSEDLGRTTIVASSPLFDSNGKAFAVIAGRVNMVSLNEILAQQAGLGETGETYLITENHLILTPSRFEGSNPRESYFSSPQVDEILKNQLSGEGIYNGYRGVPVFGVYRWLPDLQMALLTEQFQSESLTTTRANLIANAITATAAVLVAILIGLFVTRRITHPLKKLADTAEKIAAGNLNLKAEVEREDEIGALATTFNNTTAQLRNIIAKLEERITDRTREAEQQSMQLRLAAQVARDFSQSNDLNELLTRAALLIHDRFHYYHVGIYLIDERREFAILRSAAGEAGQELLEQGHRLKLSELDPITSAIGNGKPHLTNIENLEENRAKSLLPETQSEAALPLKVGNRIVGVLDLHSTNENDFVIEMMIVLEIMADQLAIGIENMYLLNEMEENVRKLESAYGKYTAGTWQSFVQRTRRLRGLRYRGLQSEPPGGLTTEAVAALQTQKPILGEKRHDKAGESLRSNLAIPMRLRGHTLGVVNIEFEGYHPTQDTVAFYEEVVERLALALDNVRLIEETNLRSEQLKLLQEITAAAASHVNLEQLFEDVTDRIRSGFEADHCGVILFDLPRNTGTLVSSNSAAPISPAHHLLGTKIPLHGEQILENIIQNQKSCIMVGRGDPSGNNAFNQLLESLGTVSQVFVPLASRGELLGAIMLNIGNPERNFGEDDLLLLDQISLQITIAIEVARIFEKIERRAQRERQISEITSKVRSSTNVDVILQTAVQELAEALDVPKGTIKLRQTKGSSDE